VGGKKLFHNFIVGVNPTAAGKRERRINPTAAGKRGRGESPPHEARSWSLQFSPALPGRKDDLDLIRIDRAVLQD
jgi:hypothetical protein